MARPASSSSRSGARSAGGPSVPALMAVGLVVVLAAAIGLFFVGQARAEQDAPQALERHDPFADLPPDVPKPRAAKSKPSAGSSALRDLSRSSDDPIWREALDFAARADRMLSEAIAAKDDGASETARSKGHDAQTLFQRALETANPWLEELRASRPEGDPLLREVEAETQRWTRELVVLKKVAGV